MCAVLTTGLTAILPMAPAQATGKTIHLDSRTADTTEGVTTAVGPELPPPPPGRVQPMPRRPAAETAGARPDKAVEAKATEKKAGARPKPPAARRHAGLFRKLLAGKLISSQGPSPAKPAPAGFQAVARAAPLAGIRQQIAQATNVKPKASPAAGGKATGQAIGPQAPAGMERQVAPSMASMPIAAGQAGAQKNAKAISDPARDPAKPKPEQRDQTPPRMPLKGVPLSQPKPTPPQGQPSRGNPPAQAVSEELSKGQVVPLDRQAAAPGKTAPQPAGTAPRRELAATARVAAEPAGPVPAGQAKTPTRPAATQQAFGKVLADIAQQAGVGTAVPAGTEAAPPAPQAPAMAPGAADGPSQASVTNQIAEAVRSGAVRTGQKLVIRLHPPELGQVRLALQAEGKDVRAVLEVDSPRTLVQIQRETPALIQRLSEGGVQLRRLDVNLNDSSSGQPSDSALRDGQSGPQQGPGQWSQQPAEPESDQTEATPEEAPSGESPADDLESAEAAGTGQESVNLWI